MPYQKGHKKLGGKKKGTPNVATKSAQMLIIDIVNGEMERVKPALTALYNRDKYKYLLVIDKLLSYAAPKMQTTAMTLPFDIKELVATSIPYRLPDDQPE